MPWSQQKRQNEQTLKAETTSASRQQNVWTARADTTSTSIHVMSCTDRSPIRIASQGGQCGSAPNTVHSYRSTNHYSHAARLRVNDARLASSTFESEDPSECRRRRYAKEGSSLAFRLSEELSATRLGYSNRKCRIQKLRLFVALPNDPLAAAKCCTRTSPTNTLTIALPSTA